jgi:crotonobetainyl-CoA:carnitine CoA-transferase CaiB-like acyl-CoA transferase
VKPDIIYCSITGFGQSGPYAPRAGYDYLAQGMGGIMSLTGEPEAAPVKVGIGIADVMCGMYAVSAILAALHHRTRTGEGQYIDLALLDTQVAWLVNEGVNYLTSGQVPKRQGSEHPNIVPYKVMPAADGYFILAVGNDAQFKRFCEMAGCPHLAEDSRFATNRGRVTNRVELYAQLPSYTRLKPAKEWVDGLSALGVPAGPVNDLKQVFEDPQIVEREMQVALPLPDAPDGLLKLIGNPIKFSETPVTYRRPPPAMGEHSVEVLAEVLGLSEAEVQALVAKGVV